MRTFTREHHIDPGDEVRAEIIGRMRAREHQMGNAAGARAIQAGDLLRYRRERELHTTEEKLTLGTAVTPAALAFLEHGVAVSGDVPEPAFDWHTIVDRLAAEDVGADTWRALTRIALGGYTPDDDALLDRMSHRRQALEENRRRRELAQEQRHRPRRRER